MKENKTHQLVYLFRHKGTNYVKIGMTSNNDCAQRFQAFCTYSPYGGEIVGTIKTSAAKKLEKDLHQKYANKRLSGEFFELTQHECEQILLKHENKVTSDIISAIKQIESTGNYESLETIRSFIDNINIRHSTDNDDKYNNMVNLFRVSDKPNMTCTEISDYIHKKTGEYINPVVCGLYIAKHFPKKRVRDGKIVKRKYFIEPKG